MSKSRKYQMRLHRIVKNIKEEMRLNKEEYKEQFGKLITENYDLKKQVLELTIELAELKDKLAHYPYTPTDGLEVGNPEDYEDKMIYESPDNGETVYGRRFQEYKSRKLIKDPRDISKDE